MWSTKAEPELEAFKELFPSASSTGRFEHVHAIGVLERPRSEHSDKMKHIFLVCCSAAIFHAYLTGRVDRRSNGSLT